MPTLRDIQEGFARHLDGSPTDPDIAGAIKYNQLENSQRLQVYRNNFRLGLSGNLAAIYPVIEKLVGAGFFNHACMEYIAVHPSRHGDLHRYGDEFDSFLAEFEPARALAYLPAMARFEWAYHEVFHEADTGNIDIDALSKVDETDYSNLVFRLHPATRLVSSRFPLLKIWQQNQHDEPEQLELKPGKYAYLLGRRNNEMIFQDLDEEEIEFLSMLEQRLDFGAVTDQMIARFGESCDINTMLARQVTAGNICGFDLSTEPPARR